MSKITCRFVNSKKERGTVSFEAKYDYKYYTKYHMNWMDRIGCDKSISIKDLRYINWSDKTGFVPSSSYQLPALCHKRPRQYIHNPVCFDHTTYWRKPGDKFPCFCLTEPYCIDQDDIEKFININSHRYFQKYNLMFKIFERSQKSLWCPPSTFMIFWWCPKYFCFEMHEELLMSHEDASEFEKKCEIIVNNNKSILLHDISFHGNN